MSNYPWDDGSGDTSKSTKYTLNDLNRAAGVEGDNQWSYNAQPQSNFGSSDNYGGGHDMDDNYANQPDNYGGGHDVSDKMA